MIFLVAFCDGRSCHRRRIRIAVTLLRTWEKKNESQSYNLYATIKYKMIIQVPGESLDASMTVTFMNTSIDRWTDLFLPWPSVYSTHGLSVLDSSDLNCTNSNRLIRTLSMALFSISIISRGLMTLPIFCGGARSWAPWVRKFDYPCIWEILVILFPYARPSAPQAYQCKITQSTGIATQSNTGFFGGKLHGHPDFLEREREKKKQSQIRLNFKSLLTWLTETEKELKR